MTTCLDCGGPIHRRPNVALGSKTWEQVYPDVPDTRPWLHLRDEDWQDNPHTAVPDDRSDK